MIRRVLSRYRFWLILSLLFASQVTIIGAFFLSIRVDLHSEQRMLLDQLLTQRAGLLALLSLLLVSAQGIALKFLIDRYLDPMARLAEEAILLTSNPAHRIVPEGAREVRALAAKLNTVASTLERLHQDVEARIAAANRALTEEKNRLAALMSELPQGVLVCNTEGTILLYNTRARQLLEAYRGGVAGTSPLGLGRSLFGMLERGPVAKALEQVRQELRHAGKVGASPVSFLAVPRPGGGPVPVRIAPVLDGAQALQGFVLTLDDGTEAGRRHPDETGSADLVPARPRAPLEIVRRPSSRPEFYDFDLFHQERQNASLDERPLTQLSYTVFDTETTGLHPAAGDEIISIGALRIVNGRLLAHESFDQLVQPGVPLDPQSSAIHGIDSAMLKGQPGIEQVLPQFHRFADDTVLVAHNAAFDMKFLQMQEERTSIRFCQPVLDTLLLSQVIHPHQKDHSLEAIAQRFGVDLVGRHTALGDTLVTGKVFLKMIPLLAEKGILTLKQTREAEQQTPYARVRY